MQVLTHFGTGTEIVAEAVRACNPAAELVTIERKVDAYRKPMDALILLGGADINPSLYGEETTYSKWLDKDRDMIEWIMLRRAMAAGVPIMGICRGHQMLAVAHGGTLHQDIYACTKERHQATRHTLRAEPMLADVLPTLTVNSLHHQAVAVVPHGFKVLARAGNVIEAIWRQGVLGVQWHPELLFPDDDRWIFLFDWFINGGLRHGKR